MRMSLSRSACLATCVSMAFFWFCFLLCGCQVSRTNGHVTGPAIEFTSVPVAGPDNPDKLSTIKGRVIGAQAGQQIVLYAKGQTTWWVQPFANQPLTKIQSNSKWSNSTHPGAEYAALLVGPDFHPLTTTDVLPTEGVIASVVAKGELAFWQRWWFPAACLIAGAFATFGFHRLRLYQLSKQMNRRFDDRLAERTRVAHELHDTLLQGLLSASMQLHVAVDQLPDESPARPALNRVLQLMAQVVAEGRNTLRGLQSSIEGAHDLKASFSQIPQELGNQQGVDFRVIVEGTSMPLRPAIRDEVYSICREALVNAFRHSRASKIEVELDHHANRLRVLVRDNGCGVDPQVLQFGRDGHWGLLVMRERAERIGAKLKVMSCSGGGTEVELRVPGDIAYESHTAGPARKWFTEMFRRRSEVASQDLRRERGN